MKKCIGITIIDKSDNCFRLISLSIINSKKDNIILVNNDIEKAYKYKHLSDCLNSVQNIVKNNGYMFSIYDYSFDTVWYANNVYFTDELNNPRRYSKLTYNNKF